MKYVFERVITSYIIEVDPDDFIALLDSESYATDEAAYKSGNQPLSDKLDRLIGVNRVDYSGHYCNYINLDIDVEDDDPGMHQQICHIIEEHLKWCRSLELVDHVNKSREKIQNKTCLIGGSHL